MTHSPKSIIHKEQQNSAFYRLLNKPLIYSTVQSIFGGKAGRERFISFGLEGLEYQNVLDIGCGTSEVLPFLKKCNYFGFEPSSTYSHFAESWTSESVTIFNKMFDIKDQEILPKFDVVLMQGVMHHMSNEELARNFAAILSVLKPGGHLLTIDPTFHQDQSKLSRFFVSLDRGKFVRSDEMYMSLLGNKFEVKKTAIHRNKFPPFSNILTLSTPLN